MSHILCPDNFIGPPGKKPFFVFQKDNWNSDIDDVIINVPHFVSGQFYWVAGQKAFFSFLKKTRSTNFPLPLTYPHMASLNADISLHGTKDFDI